MAEKLTAIKGMNDILPPHSTHWQWLEDKLRTVMERFAYRNIRTPIVEHTGLFVHSLGEVTDVVEKEMYSLFLSSLSATKWNCMFPTPRLLRCSGKVCRLTA